MKVLNYGSLNLDYVYQVEHFVQPGETLSAMSQRINPGGKGLNQSVALSRAGAEVEKTLDSFDTGDWLVLQNEINNLPLIVEKAYCRGMRIVLNPSPYNEKLSAVDFGKLEWLLVNEVELEQLSGSKQPEEAWQKIHEKYPRLNLLVTLGGDGSVAFTEKGAVRQAAFKAKAVDTTAAGDTYTGYFIAGLMEGRGIQESMRRASMASGISVTRAGAAPSIPTVEEVEQALEEQA